MRSGLNKSVSCNPIQTSSSVYRLTPMRRLLYQDESRLEYGRRFWRDPAKRERLLRHWLDERHPYSDRLRERWLPLVDHVLRSEPDHDDLLDAALQSEGVSLRAVVKEIPPVFGTFFATTDRRR